MLIAVCDDEKMFCNQIKDAIYSYSNEHNMDIVVEIFLDGDELLKSDEKFDMVFLDYQMPKTDGLETAKEIRNRNMLCTIVFITSYSEIVYDTFLYETFRFILKPLKIEKLYEALDSYIKKIGYHYPISVNVNDEHLSINTSEIMYIEADGKNSVIRLNNRIVNCSYTLSKVASLLPHHCFFRSHRSFYVNFDYIESYNKTKIKFRNGEYAKISRSSFNDFKKNLSIYFNDNNI